MAIKNRGDFTMASKSVRQKTKYPNIYFNQKTKKYDVKYNFKEYDIGTGRNRYRSKWTYNLPTIAEAQAELARLRTEGKKTGDKEITLKGGFEKWKEKAIRQNYSPVTIENTENFMKIIYRFVPETTKMKNINEDVYYQFCGDIRSAGYSQETLASLNATFRKVINCVFKNRLIAENILLYTDNMKTMQKDNYRVITKREFDLFDDYLYTHSCMHHGKDSNIKYRLLYVLLYYTGLRIGEALALKYKDFEEYDYYKRGRGKRLGAAYPDDLQGGRLLSDMRVNVNKAYAGHNRISKDPKNHKKRTVPLAPAVVRLYAHIKEEHESSGGKIEDDIFTFQYAICDSTIKKVCRKIDIPPFSCHSFRHTFISNLIKRNVPLPIIEKVSGDTQATILKRYSHMFESDEVMVLLALEDL